jgi:hypothetical protein
MAKPLFEVVEDDDPPIAKAPPEVSAVMLALKALSQRALTAVTDCFTLVTVGSAWWLWWSTPDPTYNQIVSLSIFAAFVLAANVIVRRK